MGKWENEKVKWEKDKREVPEGTQSMNMQIVASGVKALAVMSWMLWLNWKLNMWTIISGDDKATGGGWILWVELCNAVFMMIWWWWQNEKEHHSFSYMPNTHLHA